MCLRNMKFGQKIKMRLTPKTEYSSISENILFEATLKTL